jgi:alkylation response protein AidB-like acyl-CoA dehydrogenase
VLNRSLFGAEHEAFRRTARAFIQREVAPNRDAWEKKGIVPREVFAAAGQAGLLGFAAREEFGGAGADDFRFNTVLHEEYQRAGVNAATQGFVLHNDTCLPYFLKFTNDEQKRRWLPGITSGVLITAIAMTEPSAGSDLAALKTAAVRTDGGYRVTGSKTFITNGINSDLVITAVRTGADRHRGISLVIIERDMVGFRRGRRLEKIGLHSQDTAELFFDDVFVPAANLLGEEGAGFGYMIENLAQERLSIAAIAIASAREALNCTLAYVRERTAFGRPIGSFQNSKFVLAELATAVEVAQAFFDKCVEAHIAGGLSAEDAAMAKYWCSELQNRVVDRCLQLFGGYGYMAEQQIARAFVDARVLTIYGGTSEVMKEIIGRSLGL